MKGYYYNNITTLENHLLYYTASSPVNSVTNKWITSQHISQFGHKPHSHKPTLYTYLHYDSLNFAVSICTELLTTHTCKCPSNIILTCLEKDKTHTHVY